MDIRAEYPEKPTKDAAVNLANRLLKEFRIPATVVEVEDISSSFFVVLYESLFSDRLPGIIRQPACKDDEIHNCQIVIDVLSSDVIHDSLSHIRGLDIVAGDVTAIFNLLDIFAHLLEYVMNKIDSDYDDSKSIASGEASQQTTPEAKKNGSGAARKPATSVIRSGVRKVERPASGQGSHRVAASLNKNENRKAYDDHKVISYEEYYSAAYGGLSKNSSFQTLSPIRPDQSQSLLGQKTVESDFEIETEKVDRVRDPLSGLPKRAWEAKPASTNAGSACPASSVFDRNHRSSHLATSVFDRNDRSLHPATSVFDRNDRSSHPATSVFDRYDGSSHPATSIIDRHNQPPSSLSAAAAPVSSAFSATEPLPSSKFPTDQKDEPFRSTIGQVTFNTHPAPQHARSFVQTNFTSEDERTDSIPPSQKLSPKFKNLSELVKKTAELTRAAITHSPVRKGVDHDIVDTHGPVRKGVDHDLIDAHNTARRSQDLSLDPILLDEPELKLSNEALRLAYELNDIHMSPTGESYQQSPGGKKKVAFATSKLREHHSGVPSGQLTDSSWQQNDKDRPIFSLRPGDEKVTRSRDRKSTNSMQKQAMGSAVTQNWKQAARSKNGTKSLARHLTLNRQPELGAAHLSLKQEDQAVRRKHELLKNFYDKDHEDFVGDFEDILGREQERAAATEKNFIQKCAVKKKKVSQKSKGGKIIRNKSKGTAGQLPRKKIHQTVEVDKEEVADEKRPASAPATLESEEDLLPFLMEEFPCLHLSQHTWHELWRKGLFQIESLTRVYQEIERKKSRAQAQLTEAAQRHTMFTDIMKKQLEHSRRMQDIKEKKQNEIQLRNKTHEKRIQSARARHYYNEYQVRARSKVLKKRTKEEMVFRELFRDALSIQRERMKDIRKYASDQRKRQEEQRQNDIDSLENYYHNQFDMLAERMAKEKYETEVRGAAQTQMMERMKRELRKKMESEIRQYQEQIFHNDDDTHFRQADADRIRQYLHTASYPVKV